MAESPGGAVTFLFTDIEGSTAIWERYPETMGPALSRHDGILHTAVERHRGRVFKNVGDGVHAVFDRARDAFEAALAIQDAIATANWDDVGALRVRIALHTGAAEPRDGDFYGTTINRLARLLDAMAGGEILATHETVHHVGGDVPAAVTLQSLGELTLRGVSQPLQVYRLETGRAASGGAVGRSATFGESAGPAEASGAAQPPRLRVFMLGDFRVVRDGTTIEANDWTVGNGRQLFKCLLTRRLRRLAREEAQDLFLPRSADAARGSFRTLLRRLRRFLEPDVPVEQSLFVLEGDSVAIRRGADLWVDADAFEQIIRGTETPDALLEEADRLYQGDYLPDDVAEEWTSPRREELRHLWTELQLDLARSRERRGDVEGAAAALQKVLAKDGCDERAARELMLLWGRHGRRSDAHRVYVQLVEALRRELDGATPSHETREVHRQVIEGDVTDGGREAGEPAPPGGAPGTMVVTRPDAGAAPPVPPEAPPPPTPPVTVPQAGQAPDEPFEPSYPFPVPDLLVGRQRELLEGRRALERARIAGRTVLIGATAGTGKSTLAGALVEQARSIGYLCLVGGSFDQESPIPYGPIRDALADYLLEQAPDRLRSELGAITADLEPIVPELRYVQGLGGLGGPGQRSHDPTDAGRLLSAVYGLLRALAARQPVLLCLEDLHAADGATLQALHHLARRIVREPIVLIGTYRTEEALQDRPLTRVLAAMTRERLVEEIRLATLDRAETELLVSSLLGGPVSESLIEALVGVTEGNPLFVEQLVLALREEGEIVVQHDGKWHPVAIERASIPPIVRDVIERRFGSLEPACRETLEVAAVFGQTFELRPLVAAIGTVDESRVINYVDAAVDAQLVRETTGGYRFGHAMVCEALYRGLRGRRREQLHARVGEAVEAVAGVSFVERAAELAHHFRRAGDAPERRQKALTYSLVAGRRAADLSSFREAREHYVHACELTHRPDLGVEDAIRIEALEGRAWAERQLGMWTSCVATCRAILGMSSVPLTRARARSMTCRALNMLGSTRDALREAETGLVELGDDGDDDETARTRIQLLYDQAFLGYLFGKFRRVETLALEMLGIAERHGWSESYFLPHSTLALALMHQGRDAEAVDAYRLGIAAAEGAGDRLNLAVLHENLGRHHYLAGRFEAAMPELGRAIELYRATVSDVRSVNALRLIGLVMLGGGHVGGASEHAQRALAIALEGQDRWEAECRDLLGAIQLVTASWEAAAAGYGRALEIRERVSHADGMVESLVGLATVEELRGAWDVAEHHARRALDISREMDPCPDQARPLRLLGRILLRRGDLDEAARYLDEANAVCEQVLPTLEAAPTLLALADLRLRAGDPSASALVERALEAGGTADVLIEAHVKAAELACQAGDVQAARGHVRQASDLSERMPAPRLRGLIHLASARLAILVGNVTAATTAFEEARLAIEEARVPYDLAVVLREYGRLLVADGNASEGGPMLEAARASFGRLGARADAASCE